MVSSFEFMPRKIDTRSDRCPIRRDYSFYYPRHARRVPPFVVRRLRDHPQRRLSTLPFFENGLVFPYSGIQFLDAVNLRASFPSLDISGARLAH